MATASMDVKSELRGFHWVAWLTRPGETRPADGLLVVGLTREEAEARARDRLAVTRWP